MIGDIIIVNCKTYTECTRDSLVKLAKAAEAITKKSGVLIAIAPQSVDIAFLATQTRIPILSQHVDAELPGACTGAQVLESLAAAGACGSILNHSENRVGESKIKETLKRCTDKRFHSVLCGISASEVAHLAKLSPSCIAVEPPELIGGSVSVSSANPKLIRESVKAAGKIPLLVGAGIKNAQDVRIAKELGAQGVLVASGVVLAKDPAMVLRDLASGF